MNSTVRRKNSIGKGKRFVGQHNGLMVYKRPNQPHNDDYTLIAVFQDARHLLRNCGVEGYDAVTLEEVATEMVELGNWVAFASWLNEVHCNLDLTDNDEKRRQRLENTAERGMVGSIERINAIKHGGNPLDIINGIDQSNGITPFLSLSNGRNYYVSWAFDTGQDNSLCVSDLTGTTWGADKFVRQGRLDWQHPAVDAFGRLQQAQFAVNGLRHFPDTVKSSVLHGELCEIGRSLLLKLAKRYLSLSRTKGKLTINGLIVLLDGEPIKSVFKAG